MCFLIAPKWDPVTKLHLYVRVTFQFSNAEYLNFDKWCLSLSVCGWRLAIYFWQHLNLILYLHIKNPNNIRKSLYIQVNLESQVWVNLKETECELTIMENNHRDISNVMQIKSFQQVFWIKSQLKTIRGKPRLPMEMFHRYLHFHFRPTLVETEFTDIKRGTASNSHSPCSGYGSGMN